MSPGFPDDFHMIFPMFPQTFLMTSHVCLLFSIGINYHSPCSYFSQSIPLYYHTIPMVFPFYTQAFVNHSIYIWLVVWNIWIIFPYIGNFIIPTDELHHFSEGRYATNQYIICYYCHFPTKISLILQVPHCFPLYPTLFPIKISPLLPIISYTFPS